MMHLGSFYKNFLFITSLIFLIGANSYAQSDTATVNTLLKSSNIALDSNRLGASRSLAYKAFKLSTINNFKVGEAKSLLILARVQSASGAKDSAMFNFKRALNAYKSLDDKLNIAWSFYWLGNHFTFIGNQDSAEFYINKCLPIFMESDNQVGITRSYNNLGTIYYFRADYSKALENFMISLDWQRNISDKTYESSTLNNIGAIFKSQGQYPKALDYFFQSLKIQEELKDYRKIALLNNNIGLVYQQLKDTAEASKYYQISLENCKHINDSAAMTYSLLGLAEIYRVKKDYHKALENYYKAEKIRIKHSNYVGLADLYVNISRVYSEMNELDKSISTLLKALSIFENINAPLGKAEALVELGKSYLKSGQVQQGIKNCNEGIKLANSIGAKEIIRDGYSVLSSYYENTSDFVNAFKNYKQYILYRDSIGGIEKTKELQRIKFENDLNKLFNKERIDNNNKLSIAENNTLKQSRISKVFIIAFLLTLFGLVIIFLNYREKQKRNNLLAFQKLDMERQKAELMVQRDELEIQKNLVIHQRDKIMAMLTDLGESIDYARKIQQALLPSDKTLSNALGEYFLFFQPRESVGGDFYWVYQNEDIVYFAVGDCTGHGVPGGFMSMLGVSLLNEQVSREENITPAKMLWGLREMIVKALNQTGLDEDSQDGMDIALCTLNKKTRELVYSGANISLFLTTEFPPKVSELVYVQENIAEFKPDRMPVSFYLRMSDFNEHKIQLNPGDCIYLTSDGFADQFGGPSNKKFGYNTLRNLLLSVSVKPIDKQRDFLWNEFDKWKGEESQTDDVIVLGIKIS